MTDLPPRFRKYVFWWSIAAISVVLWIVNEARSTQRALEQHIVIASACVLGVFLASAMSEQSTARAIGRNGLRDARLFLLRTATWVCASAFIGVVAIGSAFASRSAVPTGAEFVRWYRSQPRLNMPFLVRPNVLLVAKFNDYQCPGCRQGDVEHTPIITRLADATKQAVEFVTIDYPIETECNPYVTVDSHPVACEAAVAVRLARERGRGAEMERWLWDRQTALSPEAVVSAARDISGVDDFQDRYQSVLQSIRSDIEHAHTVGVGSGTLSDHAAA